MKFGLVLISFCFISTSLVVAQPSSVRKTKAELKKATVFLDKAQLSASAKTDLEAGTTEIRLTGLPATLDPQSLKVGGKGNFTLVSVQYKVNYLSKKEKNKELAELEDTIKKLKYESALITEEIKLLDIEEKAILENQKIGGHEEGLEVKELEKLANFIRERFLELRKMRLDLGIDLQSKSEILQKFQDQWNQDVQKQEKAFGEVWVTCLAKEATDALFELEYLVPDAGWYPVYDIRVKNTKDPVQLAYKAQVFQRTGIDWKNIKLTLSTSNPSQGGVKPVLYPWYLNIFQPVAMYKSAAPAAYGMAADQERSFAVAEAAPAATLAATNQVSQNNLAVKFDIGLPVSIKSGDKEEQVELQLYPVSATYAYAAVPKYDTDAFLMAYIREWENLNLLPGKALVYFDGGFVGETFIDPNQTGDSLAVSLGRDKKVIIDRKLVKEFSSKKFIGLNKKEEYGYTITIRNTYTESIQLTLEDQVPVSQNSEIEVEVIDKGGAELNATTGTLTWNLKLQKGESKSFTFKYAVKYPKNKKVDNL